MSSFSEFLERESTQVEKRLSSAALRREEWTSSVRRLLDQIRGWLHADDPRELLRIEERSFHLREVSMGHYDVPGLAITFGLSEVRVEPIARNVAGPIAMTGHIDIGHAYGRVDLTDGALRYMMFRTALPAQEHWIIVEQDSYHAWNLDKDSFENALRALFE